MTKNSALGERELLEATTHGALGEDEPISSYSAWAARDTLQHWLDQSGQYRVNWVSANSLLRQVHFPFPITSIRHDRPMQLDIRIAALIVAGGTATITSQVNPMGLRDQIMWSGSDTTTSSTAVWVTDELATWTSELRHKHGHAEAHLISVDNDASSEPGTAVLNMCELSIVATSDSGTAYIVGVQVREYP